MSLTLRYTLMEHWPPLAWLARCDGGQAHVLVLHGPRVETCPDWFAEAVWAGSYPAGDFDRTDLVFGSGGRLRGDSVVFVPSGTTVDRLQVLARAGGYLVSNSLACLLEAAHADLDPVYPHYYRDFSSITRGLGRGAHSLSTSAGPVSLEYFHNLRWKGSALHHEPKPQPARDFSSFARYRAFLDRTLELLSANLQSADRRHRYRLLGTLSSGYDSPTIAVLARPHGLSEVLSFRSACAGCADDGQVLGSILGLRVYTVARDAWRHTMVPEAPFLAADAKGEDVYFAGAEAMLAGRVLLTGFHGDKMWDRDTTALGDNIVRGDQSGLSLTEYRLRVGFLHCPLAFAGVRQVRDVNAISRSPELKPWDVTGSYSRPICRRIVEDAGVPRHAFGVAKRASSVLFFRRESFLSPSSLADYQEWLAGHAAEWRRRGRTPPVRRDAASWRRTLAAASRLARAAAPPAPRRVAAAVHAVARRLDLMAQREPLFEFVFPWAIQRARAAYAEGHTRARATAKAATRDPRDQPAITLGA
ncbi:MAG TPA: hypothetical protein VD793_11485 [Gemmatimonadales bacterium]|nr:hypothetical protein [Gemmatimonadales bacterium]